MGKKLLLFVSVAAVLTFTDITANFTCADSSSAMCDGSKWTVLGTGGNWGIFGNEAYKPGANGRVKWTNDTFTNDQYVTVIEGSIAGVGIGPCVRLQTITDSGYCTTLSGTIDIWTSGVDVGDVATGCSSSAGTGTTWKLDATGTTITLFKNGVSDCSGTSIIYASGAPGMVGDVTNKTLSSWAGGPTSGGAASFIPGIINAPIRGGGLQRIR